MGALVIVIANNLIQQRRHKAVQGAQESQYVRYSTSVKLKRESTRFRVPRWALGAVGFELVVRAESFQVIGPGAVSTWLFDASGTSIQLEQSLGRFSGAKEWIRVESIIDGRPTSLLVSPFTPTQLSEAWNALVAAGVNVESGPPPLP
jgi:hypothetical protein